MTPGDIVMVPMRRLPHGKRGALLGESAQSCRYSDAVVARALELRRGGCSREAVAREIGCSPRILSFWESGSRTKQPIGHKFVPAGARP
jgi:transposase-like protein